jgi:hypothetical protein
MLNKIHRPISVQLAVARCGGKGREDGAYNEPDVDRQARAIHLAVEVRPWLVISAYPNDLVLHTRTLNHTAEY